jgi:hypothetical protein
MYTLEVYWVYCDIFIEFPQVWYLHGGRVQWLQCTYITVYFLSSCLYTLTPVLNSLTSGVQ